jgi:branched-chain amino acid transport system permease protein
MRWWIVRFLTVLGVLTALFFGGQLISDNMDEYVYRVLIQCGIYIVLAVSLNMINGITGQFSIGHAGFYAVGAYVGAAWTTIWSPALVTRGYTFLQIGSPMGDSLNLCIALALGALVAGMAGVLVGLPSLRLRGDYLAIVTLGFGEVIRVLLLNIDAVGGARGISGIPTLTQNNNMGFFWVFLWVTLAIMVSRNLCQSVCGLTFLAVREDEIAADAMGVHTTQVKVTAFVIGSAFAGAAGVLYAHFFNGISPDAFDMNTSISITTMVVLGGSGSITGSVLAASFLTALPEMLRFLQQYRMVIFSLLLVVVMLTRPQGLFGHKELSLQWLFRRRKTRAREAEA